MAQDQIEIITVNDGNSAEIEEPAGAAVDEAFNAHERSNEADSGSQPPNPNYTRNFRGHREWGSSGTREKAEGFVYLEQQLEGRGFWYWHAFLQSPIWLLVSVSSVYIRLLQFCADRFPHLMAQDQIEIITVNDGNSAEIEVPAGAAVGEAFNAYERSNEADSGSQPQNLNYTRHELEIQHIREEIDRLAREPVSIAPLQMSGIREENLIQRLAEGQGLEPTKYNLWKVAFEHYSEAYTRSQNLFYKREEEIRSLKNEIYQVVGFFSALQGLLITAAAQSNLLRCNNVGFILALSAFGTAVAVFGIVQKNMAMEELRFASNRNKHRMQRLHVWLDYLRVRGINFDFDVFHKTSDLFIDPRTTWKKILVSYGTCLAVSVIAFGGLCMVAMRQIVCNPGHSLPSN